MPDLDPTPPQPTFDVLRLSAEVRKAVDELGYTHPTPVQRAVFEAAKKGGDLVVQARTGTGKTAAFGLPLADGLVRKDVEAIQAMVLCPTRELALQVANEVSNLAKYRQLKVVSVYGGAPMQRQIDQIADGAHVLVGTPGRVLDHLRRGTLNPARIKILVLDESDEMLSMGFLPQINEVLEALPKTIQTLLFSATVPREVVRMAENRLRDPSFITLSGDAIGALEIEHYTYLSSGEKLADFLQVVETENPESAIVFCNTRDQTKRVAHHLKQAGYDADWLNAELSQSERERVMAAVRDSKLRFLVATDVAARGIDISHLTHVINFDFPESTEVYVHRTGRTGRAGRTGTAISMITPQDVGGVYMLKLTYRITPVERSLPSARELRTRAELDLVESLIRLAETQRPSVEDRALARRLLSHDQAEVALAMLLRDHLGPREEAAATAAKARRATAQRALPPAQPAQKPPSIERPAARERAPVASQPPAAPLVRPPAATPTRVPDTRPAAAQRQQPAAAAPQPVAQQAAASAPATEPTSAGQSTERAQPALPARNGSTRPDPRAPRADKPDMARAASNPVADGAPAPIRTETNSGSVSAAGAATEPDGAAWEEDSMPPPQRERTPERRDPRAEPRISPKPASGAQRSESATTERTGSERADRVSPVRADAELRTRRDRPRDDNPRDARDGRSRDGRPRDDRPRDDRPRDDRPRDDRPRDDRPRDDRPRDDRPRDGRGGSRGLRRDDSPRAAFEEENDLDLPGYTVEDASPARVANLASRPTRSRDASPNPARGGERQRFDRTETTDATPRQRPPARPEPRPAPQADQATDRPSSRAPGGATAALETGKPGGKSAELRAPAPRAGGRLASAPGPSAERGANAAGPQPATQAAPTPQAAVTPPSPAIDVSSASGGIREIRVNVGRKDGARASDFRQTLVKRGELNDADTDHVNVRHDHTLVGVKQSVSARAVAALNGATIAGQEAVAQLATSD